MSSASFRNCKMRTRLESSGLLVLSGALLCSCVSFSDLPTDLQQKAQCIAASLKTTEGIFEVSLTASTDRNLFGGEKRFAIIRYGFLDEGRTPHTVSFGLYPDPRLDTGHFVNLSEASGLAVWDQGSPVNKLNDEYMWLRQCRVSGILITS